MAAPDFVAVGHVTLDHFGDDVRPGGAALFAAVTAHRLGLTAGVRNRHSRTRRTRIALDTSRRTVPPNGAA